MNKHYEIKIPKTTPKIAVINSLNIALLAGLLASILIYIQERSFNFSLLVFVSGSIFLFIILMIGFMSGHAKGVSIKKQEIDYKPLISLDYHAKDNDEWIRVISWSAQLVFLIPLVIIALIIGLYKWAYLLGAVVVVVLLLDFWIAFGIEIKTIISNKGILLGMMYPPSEKVGGLSGFFLLSAGQIFIKWENIESYDIKNKIVHLTLKNEIERSISWFRFPLLNKEEQIIKLLNRYVPNAHLTHD